MTVDDKIRKEPLYILCIDNPTQSQIDLAVSVGGVDILHLFLNDKIFDEFCLGGGFDELSFVKNLNGLSESKLKEVIFKDYTLISKVDNPSEALQICAVNRNPDAVLLIDCATLKTWRVAIKKKPSLIDYFYDPPEDLQMSAVRSDCNSIKYIDNPTPKVQSYTIRLCPELIAYIKNIDPDVACECIKRYGMSAIIFLRRTDDKVLDLIRETLKNM